MFDQSFTIVNTQRTSSDDESTLPMLLDFKHTIFVMEDVDAASKVVQRRAAKSLYQSGAEKTEKTITTTTVTRAPSTKPPPASTTTSLRQRTLLRCRRCYCRSVRIRRTISESRRRRQPPPPSLAL